MKRSQRVFLFAALMILGVTPFGFGQQIDLTANTIYLRTEPNSGGRLISNPQAGQQYYAYADGFNIGAVAANNFQVEISLNAASVCTVEIAQAPAGANFIASCNSPITWPVGADHVLSGVVDTGNVIAETNENNNTVSHTFSQTDLIAERVYLRTGPNSGDEVAIPVSGQSYLLHFDWRNDTPVIVNNVRWEIRLRSTGCSGTTGAGGNTSRTSWCSSPIIWPAGAVSLDGIIDLSNDVAETNDGNNWVTKDFLPGPLEYFSHVIYEIGGIANGDGDGRVESGETVELVVTVINRGTQSDDFASGTISTSAPEVTISDHNDTWTNIPAGGTAANDNTLVFSINSSLAQDKTVTFTLLMDDRWTSTFTVPIYVQDQVQINAPSNLLARLQNDNTSVELTWQDNSNDEDGFRIERRTGSAGNWVEIAATGADAQSYTDTNLLPEVHSYRVRAFKGAAHSDYSNVYSVIIFAKPAPPQNLRAVAGFQQITLTWDPNSESDILRYRLYGGTAANPTTPIDSAEGGNSTNKIISGLLTGVIYYFRITAVNQTLLQSDYSNEVSAAPELFTEITVIAQTTDPTYFAAWGDYDNDNDFDILIRKQIYRNDNNTFGNVVIEVPGNGGNVDWGDYDNDGDLDILSGVFIYRNDPAAERDNFIDLGVRLMGSSGYVAWGDYDNDGDLDILVSSRVYRNDGGIFNDTGARLSFARAWGDYDNDGDLDILDKDKVYRNDGGNFADIGTALSFAHAWGDYDSDGDLDILAASKVYRNDNGSFVDINAALPSGIAFNVAWGDYDNDGDLDILLSGSPTGESGLSRVYRNDPAAERDNFVDSGISLVGLRTAVAAWGDYDNDGDLDILLSGSPNFGNTTRIYRNNIVARNTAPTAPANVTAAVTGSAVRLGWDKSTDDRTAQNALTYNLRVGKTPGGNEVMSPMSEVSSGTRRLAQLGNTNHRTSWTIGNLAPGTYYWSVQAIDHAFAGSAFAPEQSFVINPTELKPDVQSPQAIGQEFQVEVAINNVQNLFGISFELNFTNTLFLDVVTPASSSVVPGAFLGNDVVFIANVDEAAGKVNIGVSRKAGQSGISGSGVVARVKFTSTLATPAGTQIIFSFSNVAANEPSGAVITPALKNATVTLNLNGIIVWPGDTNNDRIVNQADILPIGLHFNKTGPARQNASLSWTPQLATAWTPAPATYADANGDGVVNQADVLPIGLHFGKTHTSASSGVERNPAPQVLQKTSAATIRTTITGNTNPGQDFTIDVVVSEVTDLFGVSFELQYAPTALVDPQKAESGSFMGNDPLFFSNIDKAMGKISIANTRKSGQGGVTGGGVVARIEMRVSPQAVRGQAITLTLQNATANDPNAQPIQLTVVPSPIVVVSVESRQNEALPENFALHANTPNPFGSGATSPAFDGGNPTTTIQYDLPRAGKVTVEIFDILGKHVRTLVQQQQAAGRYSVVWDGRDENGQIAASGVYLYQLRVGNPLSSSGQGFVQRRKMLLVR